MVAHKSVVTDEVLAPPKSVRPYRSAWSGDQEGSSTKSWSFSPAATWKESLPGNWVDKALRYAFRITPVFTIRIENKVGVPELPGSFTQMRWRTEHKIMGVFRRDFP
jgi:hypothetical protein